MSKRLSQAIQPPVKPPPHLLPHPSAQQFAQSWRRSRLSRCAIGLAIVLIVSSAFGSKFYAQPQLKADDIAPQTIVAPYAEAIQDAAATKLKQQAARQVFPLFMLDPDKTNQSKRQLQQIFANSTKLRQQLGPFPIVAPHILAQADQRSLRRASEPEWQQWLKALDQPTPPTPLKPWQSHAIAQLQQRPRTEQPATIAALTTARQQYQQVLTTAASQTFSPAGFSYNSLVLDLSAADWQQLQTALPPLADRILTQGLSSGLPPETRQTAFLMHTQAVLPPATQTLAVQMLTHSLEPNIVADLDQTEQIAAAAARNVPPVVINVAQHQVIVRAGEPIGPQQAMLLEHFQLDRRTINWRRVAGFSLLTGLGLASGYILARRIDPNLRPQDDALILLLALSTTLLMGVGVPSVNLPLLGLLIGSFYNPLLAILTICGISSLLPIGLGVALKPLLASLAGGLLAAGYSARVRSREDSVRLGLLVGAAQSSVYFIIGWFTQMPWSELAKWTALYGLLGLAWCVIAIGISPYLERTFDLITTIRLVELANLNRPLLKRLAAETPGTFQHTLAVANLAEAAGKELGCNVELIRTGTLYHDIGKIHDPLGFIENQMGRENKHDEIDDPWISASIIRKHITEGIVMAKRAGLPRAVRRFIPEHQGAQLISYFHHQALQRQAADPTIVVADADFRYDGPNPQSRETAIVMLADSCEAALRSVKDASPEIAANMIQKIFRARWQEGVLSESGLHRHDLDHIAEAFLQVWQQSNHRRIAYPS
jgi:cyclic-di-AMP phosphodiesterase PgpH